MDADARRRGNFATGRLSTPVRPERTSQTDLEPGLVYRLYSGEWDRLPDYSRLEPGHTGVAQAIDLKISREEDRYGITFSGYLRIDRPGEYTLFTRSDDGSALYLAGVLVVNNDGIHGGTEVGTKVALEAGLYRMEVRFFEKTGGQELRVTYAGPEIPKQVIPAGSLFHAPER